MKIDINKLKQDYPNIKAIELSYITRTQINNEMFKEIEKYFALWISFNGIAPDRIRIICNINKSRMSFVRPLEDYIWNENKEFDNKLSDILK